MIIKEKNIKSDFLDLLKDDYKKLLNKKFIVLDIETTGFSRKKANVILIGLIIKSKENLKAIQIFSEDLSEEKEILEKLIDILKNNSYDFLLTYNGHSFDLPFLNSKFNQYKINYQLNLYKNFDIYRLIRKYKSKLNIDKYNLKSIENFLNIKRKDTISGKESIKLYYRYLKTSKQKYLNKILLHNYEDILYLLPVIQILNYFTFNEIYKFYPKKIHDNLYLINIKIDGDYLFFSTNSLNQFENNEIYSELYNIKSENDLIKFKINLFTFEHKNNLYKLINHKIFYKNKFKNISNKLKNQLIISINNNIEYENLILNIKKIFNKIYNI
ncbi:MAG: ribonuclease H-like domain-containing protein [Bacillota bacterium]